MSAKLIAVLAMFALVAGNAFSDDPISATPASAANIPVLDDFLGDIDFSSPELSPSGRYLAGVRHDDGADFLLVADLDSSESPPRHIAMGDYFVNWMDWASDDRLLVAVSGYEDYFTGQQVTRAQFERLRNGDENTGVTWPIRFSRLVSVDRSGESFVAMFDGDRKLNKNFSLSRVTDFLPDDPDHILMPARLGGDLDLFKVNILTGKFERIAVGTDATYAWYTDREGKPAFRLNVNRRGTVIWIYAREDRKNGKIKWRKIKTIRLNKERESKAAPEFDILYPGPTETTYYVAARPVDADTTGIYLYDFEKDEMVDTIRISDRVDIQNAFFNHESRTLEGVFYFEDRLKIELEDKTLQAHIDGLNVYFDNSANVLPIDSSRDGKRWLIKASGPLDSGSFHIYDVERAAMDLIGNVNTDLSSKTMSPVEIVEYRARDGLVLKGYLTRPAGVSPDAMPPLIMMPHGGPEMRDYFGFDLEPQLLAAYGYQVFQPNFRGSAGYGKAFADKGRRQWGQAMQADIEDAYRYLVDAGKVAEGQACIYGYSYGGYAALSAAVQTPDDYACVIAGGGPSDLLEFLDEERRQEGPKSDAYAYWVEHIGDPKADRELLERISPARNASKITRPVLLIHGEEDDVVAIKQSELMAEAMAAANKDVRFIRLENSGHGSRTDEEQKREYLEMLAFLRTHLPTPRNQPWISDADMTQ